MDKKLNVITAVIDHLGGGSTGVKRVGVLLDITTTRVYQLAEQGLVRKPEHASILAQATGWPFEHFLLRGAWQPTSGPDSKTRRGRKRDPKASPPLTVVSPAAPSTGANEPASTHSRLSGQRLGQVVRPASRSARSGTSRLRRAVPQYATGRR